MKFRHPRLPIPSLALMFAVALVGSGCSAAADRSSTDPTTSGGPNSTASAGPGSTASASQALAGETITLYNAQHEQTTDALVTAFTKQTGIKVQVRNGDEDVMTAQIEQEGAQSPADVFYTENSPWLEQLDAHQLLSKVDATTLAQIPAADSGSSGDWVGVSARVSALVYNSTDLTAAQLPTSVMDLADPQWKGKIELAPAETDFWPIVSSVAKAYGDAKALEWLKAIKANAGANDNTPDNETLVSDVSAGTAQIGLINHYYYFRLQAEVGASALHAGLAYFAPHDPGYVLDVSGAAVLKSSRHRAAAQALVAYLTSTAGQTILAAGDSFEYPLGDHVAASPKLVPFDQLAPNGFSVADLGTGEDAKALLEQAQLI